MNNKTQSIITSLLFFILFIGLVICAYHIYTINKELDIANAKITKYAIFLNEENAQSLKKEIDTSDWETYENTRYGFSLKYPKHWEKREEFADDTSLSISFSEVGQWYNVEGGTENAIVVSVYFKDNPSLVHAKKLLQRRSEHYDMHIENQIKDDITVYFYTGFGEGFIIPDIPHHHYEFSISSNVMNTDEITRKVRPVLHEMMRSVRFF